MLKNGMVRIESFELDEFFEAYKSAILDTQKKGITPYVSSKQEFIISFDSQYRAFVPPSIGLSSSDQRSYLKETRFLTQIAGDLAKHRSISGEIPGGRVFLREDGAYVKCGTEQIQIAMFK